MAVIKFSRTGGQAVDDVTWQAEELHVVEKPNGPAAAAILAAAVGAAVLGLLTVLAEANTDIHDFLDIKSRVGPLSGKTTFSVLVYLATWAVLAVGLWRRSVPMNTVLLIGGVLLAAGFIGTFPKFFQLFPL